MSNVAYRDKLIQAMALGLAEDFKQAVYLFKSQSPADSIEECFTHMAQAGLTALQNAIEVESGADSIGISVIDARECINACLGVES